MSQRDDSRSRPLSAARALSRLQALCGASEQCEADLLSRLRRWGVADEAVGPIMEALRRDRYVDDARFAVAYAHTKASGGWGPRKIRAALAVKRIAPEAVSAALDEVDPSLFEEGLARALRSKCRQAPETYDERSRALRFALQRGFDAAAAAQAIREGLPWQ